MLQAGLRNIADRVNVGLIPSSEESWPAACDALKVETGGWLHIHGNVSTNSDLATEGSSSDHWQKYAHLLSVRRLQCLPVTSWIEYVTERVSNLLLKHSSAPPHAWVVQVRHVEHVKTYAPHISHLVLDVECRPQK